MKKARRSFVISCVFAVLGPALLLGIIFLATIDNDQLKRIISMTIGAGFWSSLILQQVFFWKADRCRRKKLAGSSVRSKEKIGIVSFFQNRPAAVADVLALSAVAVLVILIILGNKEAKYVISTISAALVGIQMHCLLNGRNFKYIYGKKERVV